MSKVIVDSSVWVAHFRQANLRLQHLAAEDRILCHPLVLLELACGTPPAPRERTLEALSLLARPVVASTDEVLALITQWQLFDQGCGAIDMALLASARLTPGASLWTWDKSLALLADRLGVADQAERH